MMMTFVMYQLVDAIPCWRPDTKQRVKAVCSAAHVVRALIKLVVLVRGGVG